MKKDTRPRTLHIYPELFYGEMFLSELLMDVWSNLFPKRQYDMIFHCSVSQMLNKYNRTQFHLERNFFLLLSWWWNSKESPLVGKSVLYWMKWCSKFLCLLFTQAIQSHTYTYECFSSFFILSNLAKIIYQSSRLLTWASGCNWLLHHNE